MAAARASPAHKPALLPCCACTPAPSCCHVHIPRYLVHQQGERSKGAQLPLAVRADIERGSLNAFGASLPLPIRGSGMFEVLFSDAQLRVFKSGKSYAVQVRTAACTAGIWRGSAWFASLGAHLRCPCVHTFALSPRQVREDVLESLVD